MRLSPEEINHCIVQAVKAVVAARGARCQDAGGSWQDLNCAQRRGMVDEMRDLVQPVLEQLPEPRLEHGRQPTVPLEETAEAVAKVTARERTRTRRLTPNQRALFESKRLALVSIALKHLPVHTKNDPRK